LEKNPGHSDNDIFLVENDDSNMRSATTSEFDEEFGRSEQTGFDSEDDDDDANLDNRKGNRKVHMFLLLIIMIQKVYYIN
jgi:hypothetical protein